MPPAARALAGTLLGSGPGFLLPFLITASVGLSRETDAWFFALALATFATGLLTVVLEANSLPVAQRQAEVGRAALSAFLARTTRQAALVAGGCYLVVVLVGAATLELRAGWSASDRLLALAVVLALAPYVLITACCSVTAAGLYAFGDFFVPMASQSLRALLPLALLAVVGGSEVALIGVALAMAVGEGLRLLLLRRCVRRRMAGLAEGVAGPPAEVWATALPHAVSMVVAAAVPVVDRLVAAPLPTGSVTLIDLGERAFYAPMLAIMSSVVLVAGAEWARLGTDDAVRLRAAYRRALRRGAFVAVAAALLVAAALEVACAVAGDTLAGVPTGALRAIVLIFLIGVPGATVAALGARLLTSTRTTRLLPWFALGTFGLNLVADLGGAAWLGVDGIAAASTLTRTASAAVYVVVCGGLLARGGLRGDHARRTPVVPARAAVDVG